MNETTGGPTRARRMGRQLCILLTFLSFSSTSLMTDDKRVGKMVAKRREDE